jgi:hypothetical protein
MTAQDWWPGLDDEEAQAEVTTPPRRRWARVGAGVLAAVLALAAVVVVAQHLAATPAGTSAAAAASRSAAGTTPAAPREGPVVIEAALGNPAVPGAAGQLAPLIVGTQPLQGRAAPDRVPNFDSCHADTTTLQYLPVQIRRPENWLGATVTVQATASTPAGIGRLGFFFQAGDSSTPCPDGTWSASDSFLASTTGQELITGYIVLDQAFSSSRPQGRPDVFRTLRLRVSKVEYGGKGVTVSPPTVGALCPGTEAELCASLG